MTTAVSEDPVDSTREHMEMIGLAVAKDRPVLDHLTRVHLSDIRITGSQQGR